MLNTQTKICFLRLLFKSLAQNQILINILRIYDLYIYNFFIINIY